MSIYLVRVVRLISLLLATSGVGKSGNSLLKSLEAPRLQSSRRFLEVLWCLVPQLVGKGYTGLLTLEQVSLYETCFGWWWYVSK